MCLGLGTSKAQASSQRRWLEADRSICVFSVQIFCLHVILQVLSNAKGGSKLPAARKDVELDIIPLHTHATFG